MRPPKRNTTDFERIHAYDEWIAGTIEEVKLEENRLTGFKDEETGQMRRCDMIRFKFKLNGQKFPKYSRWMTYSFGPKSTLYIKYLSHLVEGAQPDMDVDLDDFKGFPIKTMWSANGDFDNLEQIRPIKGKLMPRTPPAAPPSPEEIDEAAEEDPEPVLDE